MKHMNNRLKKVAVHSLLLVVPFFLTGCSFFGGSSKSNSNSTANSTITIWRRMGETKAQESAMKSLLAGFEKANKNVKVSQRVFEATDDYEGEVLNALAAGTGPDIWEIKNDELPRHKDKIFGVELDQTTIANYRKNYAPSISQELISDGKLYGLPLGLDPLVLFYNTDHLQKAGIQAPPKTWPEMLEAAQKLTAKVNGTIVRPGFAMGTASNIDRASEIIQLMMLQFKTQMTDPSNTTATFDLYTQDPTSGQYLYPARTALQLYNSFADPASGYQSWDAQQPYTTQAFTEGRLSMMINYLSLGPQLKLIEPRLQFNASRVPQLDIKKLPFGDIPASVNDPVYTARYRALVMSKPSVRLNKTQQTAQQNLARGFMRYIGQSQVLTSYSQESGLVVPFLSGATDNQTVAGIVNPYLTTWYKGKSPRSVDGVFQNMLGAYTEQKQAIDTALSQAAELVTGLLK